MQKSSLYIFECAMSLLYVAMSFVLLFTSFFSDAISDNNVRLFLGILLGLYGIYRTYRAIRKFISKKESGN